MDRRNLVRALLIAFAVLMAFATFRALDLDNHPLWGLGDNQRHPLTGLFAALTGASITALILHGWSKAPAAWPLFLVAAGLVGWFLGAAVIPFRKQIASYFAFTDLPTGYIALFGSLVAGLLVPWLLQLILKFLK